MAIAQSPIIQEGATFTFIYNGPSTIYVDSNCVAPLEWGHPDDPRVIYNGPPGGTLVGFRINSISGGYSIGDSVSAGETVTVRYRAYDNMGNDAYFTFRIDFVDTLAPQWNTSSLPPDTTIHCPDELTTATPQATDNCTDSSAITYETQLLDSLTECDGGTFIQRYTAIDEYGNEANYDQQVTIIRDTIPPMFVVFPEPDTAYCENVSAVFGQWLTQQLNRISATDNGCEEISYGVIAASINGLDTACGPLDVLFHAEDGCGNRDTVAVPFTVLDTISPVLIQGASNANASCDTEGNQALLADWLANHGGMEVSDNCEVFWTTVPETVSITDVCNGSIDVTFIAEDRCGASVQSQATFSLTDTTAPQILSGPSNLISTCGNQDYLAIAENWLRTAGNSSLEDYCSPDSLLTIQYRYNDQFFALQAILDSIDQDAVNGCSDNVTVDGSFFDGVLTSISLEFAISDPCGNQIISDTAWFAIIDEKSPDVMENARDTTIHCGSLDSIETALYEWYDRQAGFSASDDCGSIQYGASMTKMQLWAALQDSISSQCGNTGKVDVAFYAEDLCGNRTTPLPPVRFEVIDTTAPVVSGTQNIVKDCRPGSRDSILTWIRELAFSNSMESCGTIRVDSFQWTTNTGSTGTGSVQTGPYPEISSLGCNYRLDVTFYLSDECGNTTQFSAFYRLFDMAPPVFENVQDSIVLACGEEMVLDTAQVKDNCVEMPVITFMDDTVRSSNVDSCAHYNFSITRTYEAMDACGNTATFTQWIQIVDNTAPEFSVPADLLIQCDQLDSISLTGYPTDMVDDCESPVEITFTDSILGSGCTYRVERKWSATDICGNERVQSQIITVSDTIAPEVQQSPADLTLFCVSQTAADSSLQSWLDDLSATFSDNCSLEGSFLALPGSYTLSDTSTWPGSLPQNVDFSQCSHYSSDTLFIVKVDIVGFDACKNAIATSARFIVLDQEAPSLFCDPVYEFPTDPQSCEGTFTFPDIEVLDNCTSGPFDLTLEIEGVDSVNSSRIDTLEYQLAVGEYPVKLFATDCAGNTADCTFTIHITDREAPSISCSGDTTYILNGGECQKQVLLDTPDDVTDNCVLNDTLEYSYFISGATEVNDQTYREFAPHPVVILNGGLNEINFWVSDQNGNRDTCTYFITVEDTTKPTAICQPATVFANPSGVRSSRIDASLLDGGSQDNCAIDTMWTVPATVDCQQAGQQLDVVLYVADAFGNTDSCQTIMRVETERLEPDYELDICDPDTLRLFANAPPPTNVYTYVWTGPNGFISNQSNPVLTNVGPQNSGTYELTITGFDDCEAQGAVNINISDIATPDLSADPQVNCEGNAIRLISNSFSGQVTYNWYEGTPPNGSFIRTTVQSVLDLMPTPGAHDYYVVVTANNNCISNPSAPVQVEIISQPVARVDTNYISICEGEDIQLRAIDQGPGYEYRWTGPNGFFSNLSDPPVIQNAGKIHEGTYRLIVETGDCSSAPVFVEVVVNSIPSSPQVDSQEVLCVGEELILTVNQPLNAENYTWISPIGEEYTTTDPLFDFGPVSAGEAGIWSVVVESNGCISMPGNVLVNVEILPELEIEANGSFCEGDSLELSVNSYPNASYQWSGPGLDQSGREISVIPMNGIYNVTLTSENGCMTTKSRMIELIALPTITALSNSGRDCVPPGTDIDLIPTVFPADSGNYTYIWSGPNNFSSNDSIATIEDATQSDNGYYTLRVNNQGCFSIADSTLVSVTQIPAQPELSGNQVYCEGDTFQLIATEPGMGDQSYQWILPAGDTTTLIPSLTLNDLGKQDSGYYQVQTSVNGCLSPRSDSFLIEVRRVPARPAITGTTRVCEGDTIKLFAGAIPDIEYEWLLPNGSTEITDTLVIYNSNASNQGVYQVRTLLNSCSSSFSKAINVTVSQIPQVPQVIDFEGGICLLNENESFELCISNGSATNGAVYSWYNADNNSLLKGPTGGLCVEIDSFDSFTDGTNEIYVQAELNGCFSTFSIPENISMSLPEITEANGGPDRAICSNEEARLNAEIPSEGTGQWSVVEGGAIIDQPNNPNTEVSNLAVGQNLFVWSLDYGFCDNFASDTVIVLFDEAPFAFRDEAVIAFNTRATLEVLDNDDIIGPVRTSILQQGMNGTTQLQGNRIVYFPANGFIGTDTIIYQICSVNCPDLCDSASVIIQVGDESLCNIPNIFTPNNDGVNDFFTIQCLSSNEYDDNRVVIFNQYGDEVFYAQPYENSWQGTYDGEPLPVGTYYYIVDFGNGRIEKGFLILER